MPSSKRQDAKRQRKTARASRGKPGRLAVAGSWAGLSPGRSPPRSEVVPLLLDQGTNALTQQGDVERLLEGLAEAIVDQVLGVGLVLAGQSDDEGLFVLRVAPQVLGNLQRLAAAHGKVHDNAVG